MSETSIGVRGFTSAINGLHQISPGVIGLGGTLIENTTVDTTGAFNISILDTNPAFDTTFNIGEYEAAPLTFIPLDGFVFDDGAGLTGIFGRIDSTLVGGQDEMSVTYSDQANGVNNGLNVRRTNLTLSMYEPAGSTQVGYSAYDGTGVFDHVADMFYYDVATNIDIALIQAKSDQAMMRFCYNTAGAGLFNRLYVDAVGANFDTLQVLMPNLGDYANDAAAAVGGVPVDGLYHTAGTLKIRLV